MEDINSTFSFLFTHVVWRSAKQEATHGDRRSCKALVSESQETERNLIASNPALPHSVAPWKNRLERWIGIARLVSPHGMVAFQHFEPLESPSDTEEIKMDRNVASGAVGQASTRGSTYDNDDDYDEDTNGR